MICEADKVFMVEDIRCEILPHSNKRMVPFPKGHYGIVADMVIDGKDYEFADIYPDDRTFEKSKDQFSKLVLLARKRAKKRLLR